MSSISTILNIKMEKWMKKIGNLKVEGGDVASQMKTRQIKMWGNSNFFYVEKL